VKKCGDMIKDISGYIDGEIDENLCQEIEAHLSGCNNCRIMVDTLKQTFVLCRDGKKEHLPDSIQNKLNSALKKKWDEKFKTDQS